MEANPVARNFTVANPEDCRKIRQLSIESLEIAYANLLAQLRLNPGLKHEYDNEKLESIIRDVETSSPNNLAKSSAMYMFEIIKSKPFKIGNNQLINEKMAVIACELFLCMNGCGEIQTMADDTLVLMADMIVSDGEDVDEIANMIHREIMVRT